MSLYFINLSSSSEVISLTVTDAKSIGYYIHIDKISTLNMFAKVTRKLECFLYSTNGSTIKL